MVRAGVGVSATIRVRVRAGVGVTLQVHLPFFGAAASRVFRDQTTFAVGGRDRDRAGDQEERALLLESYRVRRLVHGAGLPGGVS